MGERSVGARAVRIALAGLALAAAAFSASDAQAVVATGTAKTAVILVNFAANPAQPYTLLQAQDAVFTGPTSTGAFYAESSYGKLTLAGKQNPAGDVFGYYTVPDSPANCSRYTVADEVKSMAASQGVDLSGYDHYIWYFVGGGCNTGATADQPGSNVYVNGLGYQTVAHELGHNFGLYHSNALTSCADGYNLVAVIQNCSPSTVGSEYGDPDDVMGSGPGQFNGYQKARLGWFAPANQTTVTTSGTYTLKPLEQASSGLQLLKVAVPVGKATVYYYVDYRQSLGAFDSTIPAADLGVLVYGSSASSPNVADAVPYTPGIALRQGRAFVDTANGVRISVQSADASAATVNVSLGATSGKTATDDANCVSMNVPRSVPVGSTFSATMTVANTGTTTWSPGSYDLGRMHHVENFNPLTDADTGAAWIPDRQPLVSQVAPGSTTTYTGTFTAPAQPGVQTFTWRMVDEPTSTWFGNPCYAIINLTSTQDSTAPTPPTALTATSDGHLSWGAATDDNRLGGYKLYRKGPHDATFVAWDWLTPGQLGYADRVSPRSTYSYKVTAFDSSGNESEPSNTATIQTPR